MRFQTTKAANAVSSLVFVVFLQAFVAPERQSQTPSAISPSNYRKPSFNDHRRAPLASSYKCYYSCLPLPLRQRSFIYLLTLTLLMQTSSAYRKNESCQTRRWSFSSPECTLPIFDLDHPVHDTVISGNEQALSVPSADRCFSAASFIR